MPREGSGIAARTLRCASAESSRGACSRTVGQGIAGTTVISPTFRSQPRKALIAATTFHRVFAESFRSLASQATHSSRPA